MSEISVRIQINGKPIVAKFDKTTNTLAVRRDNTKPLTLEDITVLQSIVLELLKCFPQNIEIYTPP
jgi:hypothetical protein